MARYERTKDGKPVEVVITRDGSPEDDRLAADADAGRGGWRRSDERAATKTSSTTAKG